MMTALIPRESARQQLAQVLTHARTERNYNVARVADMLGCSKDRIKKYESGEDIPTGRDWDKYKGIVNRSLGSPMYAELRGRALQERDQGIGGPTALKHNPLAAVAQIKLTAPPPAIPAPRLEPKADAVLERVEKGGNVSEHAEEVVDRKQVASDRLSRSLQALPKGWKSREAIDQRRAFALDLMRQRPTIRVNGNDSLDEALVRTFGVGISHAAANEIREQVQAEIKARGSFSAIVTREVEAAHEHANKQDAALAGGKYPDKAPDAELVGLVERRAEIVKEVATVEAEIESAIEMSRALVAAPPAPMPPASPDQNIRTAVELVLESIPNLRTFTIAVDDHGEASIDYTIREVRIVENTGSLKIKVTK